MGRTNPGERTPGKRPFFWFSICPRRDLVNSGKIDAQFLGVSARTRQTGPGGTQVNEHRPEGEDGGDVKDDQRHAIKRQSPGILPQDHYEDGNHLRRCLELAHLRDGNAGAHADLGHPLAQGGNGNLTTDNHRRRQGQQGTRIGLDQ